MRSIALLLALAACDGATSTGGTGGGGSSNPDATPADATTPADAGHNLDAAAWDATMQGQCDPFANTGCNPGQACIWVGGVIGAQCRAEASPAKTHEQACDRNLHDCQAGFACFLFQGEMPPARCRKLCRTGSHADCQGLMGASPDGHECTLVDRDRSLGACEPIVPECLPFNDMCERGKYCEYSGGRLQCLPVGMPGIGQACPINRCQKGAICMSRMGGAATCYKPCDPNAAVSGCAAMERCEQAQGPNGGLPFGLCVQ